MTGVSNFPEMFDTDANLRRVTGTDFLDPADHNNLVDAVESVEFAIGTVPAGWPVATSGDPKDLYSVVAAGGGSGGGIGVVERLSYIPNADIFSATAIGSGAWVDMIAAQNFTVGKAGTLLLVSISGRCLIGGANNTFDVMSRLVVDEAGARQDLLWGGSWVNNSAYQNALAGCGQLVLSGLAAGVHTVGVQVSCQNASNAFCQPGSSPASYRIALTVLELG